MTLESARLILLGKSKLVDQLEAIGRMMNDPRSTPSDLVLGLACPGVVAEQAAFALYRRTGRPLPTRRACLNTNPADWAAWLLEHVDGVQGPRSARGVRKIAKNGDSTRRKTRARKPTSKPVRV